MAGNSRKTKQTLTGDKTMKKEYGKFDATRTQEILSTWDMSKLNEQKAIFEEKLKTAEFPVKKKTGKWYKKDYFVSLVDAIEAEIHRRNYNTNTLEIEQETDVPAPVVEIPIPTMDKETAPETSNAGETNVKKVLHKKSPKTIDKPKKNNYINNTNKTKTTQTGDKTMNNEIAKIAPNAVKNILAAQKTNKTDTKKTYWGGWAKVNAGKKAATRDYAKYDTLETEWLELREKLGGTKSPLYHFCWKLINSNRVGVKQEPNATLRFIKNVKIRIAMANDVLANEKKYKNEIAENWRATFGTEI